MIGEYTNNLDEFSADPRTARINRTQILDQWGQLVFELNMRELSQVKDILAKTGHDCQVLSDLVDARLS
ncbi:MAG: hypothetical protein V1765_01500 [bacterium]